MIKIIVVIVIPLVIYIYSIYPVDILTLFLYTNFQLYSLVVVLSSKDVNLYVKHSLKKTDKCH